MKLNSNDSIAPFVYDSASILFAIFDISNCLMMSKCLQSDSLKAMCELQESAKKKEDFEPHLQVQAGFTFFLPDMIPNAYIHK